MNKKPIPPKGRILREGDEPKHPISYKKENSLEDKLKKEEKNKKLIYAFLLAGTASLGMEYFFDDKSLSALGYIGAGLSYLNAGLYYFWIKL